MSNSYRYIPAMQFFAREYILAEYGDIDPDEKIIEFLDFSQLDANLVLKNVQEDEINKLSKRLLEEIATGSSTAKAIAEEALEFQPNLQGTGKLIIPGALLIGIILALRIGTVSISDQDGVKLTFQSENTKEIVGMLEEVLPSVKFDLKE